MDLKNILAQLKTAGVSADALSLSIKSVIADYELREKIEKLLDVDCRTAIQLAVASKLCEMSNYPIEPYWVAPDLPALDFGAWVAQHFFDLDHAAHGPTILASLRLLFEQAPMLVQPQQKPKRLLPVNTTN